MKEVSFSEFVKHINSHEGGLKVVRDDNYTKLATEYYYRNGKLVGLIKTYFFINHSIEHEFYIKREL